MLDRYYEAIPSAMVTSRRTSTASTVSSISSTASSHFEFSSPSPLEASTTQTSIHSTGACRPRRVSVPYPLICSTNYESLPNTVSSNHAAIYCARMMALIHNTIIRALNASHAHCVALAKDSSRDLKEVTNFIEYNKLIFQMLNHHHHVEEEFLFPEIKSLLINAGYSGEAMDENVAQHEAFEPGLQIFEKYIYRTQAQEFQPRTLQHIIESFAGVLVEHLHDEIPTLLALHIVDSKDLKSIWQRAEHEATKDDSLFTALPFVLGCQDPKFVLDGEVRPFPPVPRAIRPALLTANRLVFSRAKAGVWKFLPNQLAASSS